MSEMKFYPMDMTKESAGLEEVSPLHNSRTRLAFIHRCSSIGFARRCRATTFDKRECAYWISFRLGHPAQSVW
jgi:hypothetical protein